MTAQRVWLKGNIAIVESSWTGTMAGDFMGIKATNKPVGQPQLQIFTFNDDGMVKHMTRYADGAGLMAQMKQAKGAPPVPTLQSNPPEIHQAKGTPDEDKLAAMAKGIDDVMSKDDPKAVTDGLADDADFWMNITGLPATKGKKDLTKELTAFFKAIPDQKWTTTNAWGIDGFAIVEHTVSGTQKGPIGPNKASNKPVANWHWVDIVQPTADGKLQHGWAYANMVELLMQTGAMKKPGEKDAAAAAPAAAAPKGGAAPKAQPQK
jgi:hypothetical protein